MVIGSLETTIGRFWFGERRGRRWSGALVVAGVLFILVGFSPGRLGAPASPDSSDVVPATSIAAVQANRDEDLVPERLGDTLLIRGRASVTTGVLPDSARIFVQDESAGVAVDLPEGAVVNRGDSLWVRGIVRQEYGLTLLEGLEYGHVGATSQSPEPFPLTVSAAAGETYEGRLVRVRGHVRASRSNDGGEYLLLEDETRDASARIAVFVPNHRLKDIDLSGFEVEETVTVTGVLSQHSFSEPHDDYYQILPRQQQDVEKAGLLVGIDETIIRLVVVGGLLAVIVVFALQAAVRRRTQQLAESRARFRRLAEATSEGIILHKDGEILDVNRAFTDMVGYDRDALVGRDIVDVLSESTGSFVEDRLEDRAQEAYEVVMVRQDGSSFPAEIEEKVVGVEDRNVRVAAIRDVTERKQRETELLLAKEEAEQLARLKTSLLSNMSHEFRTPITSIIGYAELILEEPEAEHERFANRIRQSGKRLSRTLQAVLEMAQLESGTLRVQEEEVAVRSLILNVLKQYRSSVEENRLSLDISGEQEVSVLTDRDLLSRIVGNLLDNAVKFTEEGEIVVTVEAAEPGVRIAVSDTGIGIDPAFRPDLFEPFKQESDGRTRTHGGTGLGLALTKRMVELLGGTIEVESSKGEGSTFTVELPPISLHNETTTPMTEVEMA